MRPECRSLGEIDFFTQGVKLIGSLGSSKTCGSHFLESEDLVLTWRDAGEMKFTAAVARSAVVKAKEVVVRPDGRNQNSSALRIAFNRALHSRGIRADNDVQRDVTVRADLECSVTD